MPFERTQDEEDAGLFAPLQIRAHRISNRFVLAAATSGTAADEYAAIEEKRRASPATNARSQPDKKRPSNAI